MRILLFFIALIAVFSSCSNLSKVQKSQDYEYKYRMAEQYYAKKKYNIAQQIYEELFPVFKGSERFEDMYYKWGYCAYYLKDYMNAENLFKGFLEVFPNSKRAEEIEYMRAYVFYKQSPKAELDQTNTHKAMGLMNTFISTHPGSERIKDATAIIDQCRAKLEAKDAKSAELYFNIGQFRAAAIAYTTLMNNFPDSHKSDEYKLQVIKAYFQYASLSIDEKKLERYEQVIQECHDFADRFPDSKLSKDVESYLSQSQNHIKALKNEQVKTAA